MTYSLGIDLGTTNSALSFLPPHRGCGILPQAVPAASRRGSCPPIFP